MTCEDYLDRQERLALQALARAARGTGSAVEQVVDVRGHVRRSPVLAVCASGVAGFVAGSLLSSSSRGALRAAWSPLINPTLGALGAMLARFLLGSAASGDD